MQPVLTMLSLSNVDAQIAVTMNSTMIWSATAASAQVPMLPPLPNVNVNAHYAGENTCNKSRIATATSPMDLSINYADDTSFSLVGGQGGNDYIDNISFTGGIGREVMTVMQKMKMLLLMGQRWLLLVVCLSVIK